MSIILIQGTDDWDLTNFVGNATVIGPGFTETDISALVPKITADTLIYITGHGRVNVNNGTHEILNQGTRGQPDATWIQTKTIFELLSRPNVPRLNVFLMACDAGAINNDPSVYKDIPVGSLIGAYAANMQVAAKLVHESITCATVGGAHFKNMPREARFWHILPLRGAVFISHSGADIFDRYTFGAVNYEADILNKWCLIRYRNDTLRQFNDNLHFNIRNPFRDSQWLKDLWFLHMEEELAKNDFAPGGRSLRAANYLNKVPQIDLRTHQCLLNGNKGDIYNYFQNDPNNPTVHQHLHHNALVTPPNRMPMGIAAINKLTHITDGCVWKVRKDGISAKFTAPSTVIADRVEFHINETGNMIRNGNVVAPGQRISISNLEDTFEDIGRIPYLD
ncbi:MAG: hypothetical protein ACK4PR_03605 [Gammaproteobacteria bacterium]